MIWLMASVAICSALTVMIEVDGRSGRRIMAQRILNEAKVDSGFQQMSRPGMAKRMDTGKAY